MRSFKGRDWIEFRVIVPTSGGRYVLSVGHSTRTEAQRVAKQYSKSAIVVRAKVCLDEKVVSLKQPLRVHRP